MRRSQRVRKGDVSRGSFDDVAASLPGTPNPQLKQLEPDIAAQRQLNGAWLGPKDKGTPVSQSQASAMAMHSVGQPKMLRRVRGEHALTNKLKKRVNKGGKLGFVAPENATNDMISRYDMATAGAEPRRVCNWQSCLVCTTWYDLENPLSPEYAPAAGRERLHATARGREARGAAKAAALATSVNFWCTACKTKAHRARERGDEGTDVPGGIAALRPREAGAAATAFSHSKQMDPREELARMDREVVSTLRQAQIDRPAAARHLHAAGYTDADAEAYMERAGLVASDAVVLQRDGRAASGPVANGSVDGVAGRAGVGADDNGDDNDHSASEAPRSSASAQAARLLDVARARRAGAGAGGKATGGSASGTAGAGVSGTAPADGEVDSDGRVGDEDGGRDVGETAADRMRQDDEDEGVMLDPVRAWRDREAISSRRRFEQTARGEEEDGQQKRWQRQRQQRARARPHSSPAAGRHHGATPTIVMDVTRQRSSGAGTHHTQWRWRQRQWRKMRDESAAFDAEFRARLLQPCRTAKRASGPSYFQLHSQRLSEKRERERNPTAFALRESQAQARAQHRDAEQRRWDVAVPQRARRSPQNHLRGHGGRRGGGGGGGGHHLKHRPQTAVTQSGRGGGRGSRGGAGRRRPGTAPSGHKAKAGPLMYV